jgi:hypothetical protein
MRQESLSRKTERFIMATVDEIWPSPTERPDREAWGPSKRSPIG